MRRELLSLTPQLVGDFNTGMPRAYQRTDNAWLNGELFFAAADGSGDVELWKSDGTQDGTVRVKDIRSGPHRSLPRNLVAIEDKVLFTAYGDDMSRDLWSTDGTEAGTTLVYDVTPGPESVQLGSFTPKGDELFFVSHNSVGDDILWKTDGSSAGTQPLEVISDISSLTLGGDILYFTATAGNQQALWASDGTREGTTKLTPDFVDTVGSPVLSGEQAFFYATYDSRGWLWRSDGTADGTVELHDFGPEQNGGPHEMVAYEDGVFFLQFNRLYASDGTPDGTSVLRSFSELAHVDNLMPLGDSLIFFVHSPAANGDITTVLWRADGTRAGTERVRSFGLLQDVENMTPLGDTLFFSVLSFPVRGDHFSELWRTDGTRVGTERVHSFGAEDIRSITTIEDRLFLTVNASGLWTSDGTRTGTTRLTNAANPSHLREINGQLYFVNDDPQRGRELWRTDGTHEGTVALEIAPGPVSSDPWIMADDEQRMLIWSTAYEKQGLWNLSLGESQLELITDAIVGPSGGSNYSDLVEVSGKIFFTANGTLWQTDGVNSVRVEMNHQVSHDLVPVGDQLYFTVVENGIDAAAIWRTDGTAEGTVQVAGGEDGVVGPSSLTEAGGQLYFWDEDGDEQQKLWTLNNSDKQPVMVKELPGSSDGRTMAAGNGELFFTFRPNADADAELWRIDKSTGQPERIRQLPGNPVLLSAESQVYISISIVDEDGQFEDSQMWRSDGTAAGTFYLLDMVSYLPLSRVAVAGDRLYYFDRTEELFTSDGTVEGTRVVKQVEAIRGFGWGGPSNIVAVGETIFFNGRDPADDQAGLGGLWTSDGTEERTMQITGNRVDPIGRGPDVVYFTTGGELWQSDGTEEGTALVVDSKYRPRNIAAGINGRLFFIGTDQFHGHELWQIPIDSEPPSVPGDANRDGIFNSADLVQVFQRGEYEDQIAGNSSWEDGDWNGDGDFTTSDLVLAFQSGRYQAAAVDHETQSDDMSWIDWVNNRNRRKRMSLYFDSTDAIFINSAE